MIEATANRETSSAKPIVLTRPHSVGQAGAWLAICDSGKRSDCACAGELKDIELAPMMGIQETGHHRRLPPHEYARHQPSSNICVRHGDGLLITPTSTPYEAITPDQVHGDRRLA